MSGNESYFLITQNLEENVIHPMGDEVVIGRDQGDLVIDHESISSKHCGLRMSDGVVSITDYQSALGTKVSGQKIKPGKMVILDKGDLICVGEIEILLFLGTKEKALLNISSSSADASESEAEESPEERPPKASWKDRLLGFIRRPKKETASPRPMAVKPMRLMMVGGGARPLAGFILRPLALIGDVIVVTVAYSYLISLPVFNDEFASLTRMLFELVQPWVASTGLTDLVKDSLPYWPPVLFYFSYRIMCVLIFGVTLGQFCIGIRYDKGFVLARMLGIVRELIGMVTLPFLVFDFGPVFKRRTMKEILSMTTLLRSDWFIVAFGVLVFFPLFVSVGFFSSMLSNFDYFDNPIQVRSIPLKKVPMAKSASATPGTEAATSGAVTAAPQATPPAITGSSTVLRMKVVLGQVPDWVIIPSFDSVVAGKGARTLIPALQFFDTKTQTSGQLRIVKTYSLQELLIEAKGYDPLFQMNFAPILDFIASSSALSPKKETRGKKDPRRLEIYSSIEKLIEVSLGLSIVNLVDHVKDYGPVVAGLVHFRDRILALADVSNIHEVEVHHWGNVPVLVFAPTQSSGQFYRIVFMPLAMDDARVYEMTWEKKGAGAAGKLLGNLQQFLNGVEWNPIHTTESASETDSPLFALIDRFTSDKLSADDIKQVDAMAWRELHRLGQKAMETGATPAFKGFAMRVFTRYQTLLKQLVTKTDARQKLLDRVTASLAALTANDSLAFQGEGDLFAPDLPDPYFF